MQKKLTAAILALALPVFAVGCATDGSNSPGTAAPGTTTGTTTTTSSGSTDLLPGTAPTLGGGGVGISDIPTLINVNLQNVLNDLSVRLNIDRANVPVTIQLPITIAANVCGVSVNVLSASTGSRGTCTATTGSQELAQVVQQQMAAGGSVGGGAQGGSTAATAGTSTSGGAAGGATGTDANSTGMSETDTTP